MIKFINCNNFETIENYLLSHQDIEYKTTRYTYWFKQVGDYAGIFRRNNKKNAEEELIAYYHEGRFEYEDLAFVRIRMDGQSF